MNAGCVGTMVGTTVESWAATVEVGHSERAVAHTCAVAVDVGRGVRLLICSWPAPPVPALAGAASSSGHHRDQQECDHQYQPDDLAKRSRRRSARRRRHSCLGMLAKWTVVVRHGGESSSMGEGSQVHRGAPRLHAPGPVGQRSRCSSLPLAGGRAALSRRRTHQERTDSLVIADPITSPRNAHQSVCVALRCKSAELCELL